MSTFGQIFDDFLDTAGKYFDDNRSDKNDMSGNKNMHSNANINKAIQYLMEKGIEKAEKVAYKIIKPYDALELIEPVFANTIIKDIEKQLTKTDDKDNLYLDLFIIYINMNDFSNAKKYFGHIYNVDIKHKYGIIEKMILLNDDDFYAVFKNNNSLLLELSIYTIFRRYVNIAFAKKRFEEALPIIERCCRLNPLSKSDQNDLLDCYKRLNYTELYNMQKDILNLIGV